MDHYWQKLVDLIAARPTWAAVIIGIVAILVALVILRAVVLEILRVTIRAGFKYVAVKRAGMGNGKPAGEIIPLMNYLNGYDMGMSLTLAGVLRKWTQDQAYDQLVNAEGLGMALRIRKALLLGPSAAWPLRMILPPTASIGIGAYHALVAMVFGIKKKVPQDLLTNIINGWDAHLRIESYYFNLVLTRFVIGRTEANAALFRQLVALAEADEKHGWSLMVGLGRGCHFVIHDTAERVKLMDSFGELAIYARMGAGIPLLNTVSDDIGRLPAAIMAYPDPERRDVLTGMSIFLAFSTHFWGMEWLEQFGGFTPKLEQVLRMVQHVADDMVTDHSPISDLATVKRVLDDGAVRLGPRVEEIFAAAGLLDPATAADPAALDVTKYLEISPDRKATPPAVIVRHPELQTRVSRELAAQET